MTQRDRRFGRFSLLIDDIDERPNLVRTILKDLIVVRAEVMFHTQTIDYVAIGEPFRLVTEGEMAPNYKIEIRDLIGGKYHVTFHEVK